jgi:hypothetical protein
MTINFIREDVIEPKIGTKKKKNKKQSPDEFPDFQPMNENDTSDIKKETELATALSILVHEFISPDNKSNTLDKVSNLNEIQANAMGAFEAIRTLGGGIPQRGAVITDSIKRLSQSKRGHRSEQIKDMVIGQKNQMSQVEQFVAKLKGEGQK